MSSRQTVDVAAAIDAAPLSRFQIKTIALCFILAMVDGFDTQSIAFVAPAIAEIWQTPFSEFGPVFGLGLLGSTIGTLAFGLSGDRHGRKMAVLMSVVIFGIGSLTTIWATSLQELMVLRFFTGIGLGGALPNIIALASEYAPRQRRASLVTMMFCGFPLGAVAGGIISAKLIPAFGWESVFILGAVLALAVVPIVGIALPESIRILASRPTETERAAAIMRQISPSLPAGPDVTYTLSETAYPNASVKHLFTENRGAGTVCLWVMFFMTLLLSYFLVNWLPLVLRQAGFPLEKAVLGTVVLNAGGIVGCIVLGRLIDRHGAYKIIAPAYVLGAFFIAGIGMTATAPSATMAVIFMAGFFAIGAQFSAVALASSYYATSIRATGVGWSMGVGRVGSMIGPVVGGVLVGAGLSMQGLFLMAAMTPVLAGTAVFLMSRFNPTAKDSSGDAERAPQPQH
ncbi:MAG: MFS transporter [Rhodospirillaceae bacterium]|nr:MFS transporter [Rhodospirillaceae bacterium]